MTAPASLGFELDIAWWYLWRRTAPVRTSQVQVEHWATPALGRAWAAAQERSELRITSLGLGDDLVRRISDHEGPATRPALLEAEAGLIEHWARERLLDAADGLISRHQRDPNVSLADCTAHLRQAISEAEAGQLRTSESARKVRHRFMARKVEGWTGKGKPRSVPYGVAAIQTDIGGALRGKLHLWIAPTSGHKTTIARTHADFAARAGFAAWYKPLEDSPEDIEARTIACRSKGLTTRTVHADRVGKDELAEFIAQEADAAERLRYGRAGRTTLEMLCAEIRHEVVMGADAAYIDHLHRLRAKGGRRDFDFWCEVGDGLADLAAELDIPIIAMAQIDKNSQGEANRGDKTYTMSGVRYGGALTDPARSVYTVHRMDERLPEEQPVATDFATSHEYAIALGSWKAKQAGLRVLKIKCEKNTNGPLGTWVFEVDPAKDRIGRQICA